MSPLGLFKVGGALLTPGSLAIIGAVFGPGDRTGAIGAWAGLTAVAAEVAERWHSAAGTVEPARRRGYGGTLVTVDSRRWALELAPPLRDRGHAGAGEQHD